MKSRYDEISDEIGSDLRGFLAEAILRIESLEELLDEAGIMDRNPLYPNKDKDSKGVVK